MISREEARDQVEALINESYPHSDLTGPLVVVASATRETSRYWVVFYNSQKYIETGDPMSMLGGNSPVAVRKSDGQMAYLGTASPIEHYIAALADD